MSLVSGRCCLLTPVEGRLPFQLVYLDVQPMRVNPLDSGPFARHELLLFPWDVACGFRPSLTVEPRLSGAA